MARGRSLSGPLVLSLALHASVIGLGLLVGMLSPKPAPVMITPVTLMTSDELARLMAASQSETPETTLTEDPVPDAPPEAAVPEAPPAPEPPKVATPPPAPVPPKKAPEPAPKPAEKAPAEKTPAAKVQPKTTPQPKTPSRPVDLNALAQSIKSNPAAGPPRSAAPKGPTRTETDLQARAADGTAQAIKSFNIGVADQLGRAWRPNCGVEGATDLELRVRLSLARDGRLISAELLEHGDPNAIKDPVLKAAALRALSAASASSPYRNLPPVESYDQWRTFVVRFIGKTACSG